jgi:tRNA (guanine-N7-)-methyltransferase
MDDTLAAGLASRSEVRASLGTLMFRPASYVERLDLRAVFQKAQPVEVELGCGDGSFLVRYAQAHPERNFLGVERLLGRVRKPDRKGQRLGLSNLRLLRLEAGYALEYLLPPASIHALHVYFPDPWPKRRHQRRRLVNEHFTETARRSLTMGGCLYLRTDDQDYFEQMVRVCAANTSFQAVDTPPALASLTTDFETDFIARGLAIFRAAYQRRA